MALRHSIESTSAYFAFAIAKANTLTEIVNLYEYLCEGLELSTNMSKMCRKLSIAEISMVAEEELLKRNTADINSDELKGRAWSGASTEMAFPYRPWEPYINKLAALIGGLNRDV